MPRFKHYNYDQDAMVVINYQEQLQPGTFEHAVHYVIEHKLDLSVFHPRYRNEDTGRLAYDPAILLKIILFAYSKGITSSREMQWCCETNIIFKALSCDTVPHFTTLAKFVSSHSDEIEELFEQVLLVCHEQGLLGNELFAIDGCKMSSNAAKEWSGEFNRSTQIYFVASPQVSGSRVFSSVVHSASVQIHLTASGNSPINRSSSGSTGVTDDWCSRCCLFARGSAGHRNKPAYRSQA